MVCNVLVMVMIIGTVFEFVFVFMFTVSSSRSKGILDSHFLFLIICFVAIVAVRTFYLELAGTDRACKI
jgi:hypothetical protein